jgi:flagellin-like protein
MKILKSKKALSPVVASIILIAVTVAVSIAVAAWMGALTVGFMGSSSITITDVTFNVGTPNSITLTMKNTGTKVVTIGQVKVNGVTSAPTPALQTIQPGVSNIQITLATAWTTGNPYKIDLFDSSGSAVGSTQQNSPGS